VAEPPDRYDLIVRFVRELGFPIAVAAYLLIRLDYLLRENTAALTALTHAIERMGR